MTDFQVKVVCVKLFFFVLSLSQINASAVPKFISSVLYEGLWTVGLQMGQFNFPRVLITLHDRRHHHHHHHHRRRRRHHHRHHRHHHHHHHRHRRHHRHHRHHHHHRHRHHHH